MRENGSQSHSEIEPLLEDCEYLSENCSEISLNNLGDFKIEDNYISSSKKGIEHKFTFLKEKKMNFF